MLYDYIIIGGGISGLYTYYHLLKNDPSLNILLFEKNNYFGGRVKTKYMKKNGISYQMEEGAGRFNKNHKLLFKLIEELNLKKDVIKIGGDSYFIDTKNEFPEKKYKDKEYGDKIPADKKQPIEDALAELKKEFDAKNVENLEPAMEKLNTVFQAASQEMYNAANAGGGEGNEGQSSASTEETNPQDEVTDVDFEEVEDKK